MSADFIRPDRNSYGWADADLQAEYDVAKANGWLPAFEAAANASGFEQWELMAITSRETGPFWHSHPDGNIVGDHGKAHGLGQINTDSFPDGADFIPVPANLMKVGQELLANKTALLKKLNGPPVIPVDVDTFERMLYASWNRGVNGAFHSWQGSGDPDTVTAHGNYGADCQARAAVFARLFAADEPKPAENEPTA